MKNKLHKSCFGKIDLNDPACHGICIQLIGCYIHRVENASLEELPIYLIHQYAFVRKVANELAEQLIEK